MRETRRVSSETMEKAENLIRIGYQRLLTFETSTGGFSWFGPPPGNNLVTAQGLMIFTDMSRVSFIDPAVIARTRQWLEGQQNADGSWNPSQTHAVSAFDNNTPLRATAYVTFALCESGFCGDAARRGCEFVRANASAAADRYTRALCANALLSYDRADAEGRALLAGLFEERIEESGKTHWASDAAGIYHSTGDSADVEVTAYVAWAMLKAGGYPLTLTSVADYILARKDKSGNFGTTHATVLSLKALMAMGSGGEDDLDVEVLVNGSSAGFVSVNEGNRDVLRSFDVSDLLRPGSNEIRFQGSGAGRMEFHLGGTYCIPWIGEPVMNPALDLGISYDRFALKVGEAVEATVSLANLDASRGVFMPVAEIGLPPGFEPVQEDLDALVSDRTIERFERADGKIVFYVDGLAVSESRTFSFRLIPGIAGSLKTAKSEAFEYYSPQVKALAAPAEFTVTEGD